MPHPHHTEARGAWFFPALVILSAAELVLIFCLAASAQTPDYVPLTIEKPLYDAWTAYINKCSSMDACRALSPIQADILNLEAKALADAAAAKKLKDDAAKAEADAKGKKK